MLVVHTVAEVADILRCGEDSVYRLVKTGKLRSFRVGKAGVRITEAAIEAYIGESIREPEGDTNVVSIDRGAA